MWRHGSKSELSALRCCEHDAALHEEVRVTAITVFSGDPISAGKARSLLLQENS